MEELNSINMGDFFGQSVDKEGWEYNKMFCGDFLEFYVNINRKDKIIVIKEKEDVIYEDLVDRLVKEYKKEYPNFSIFYDGWDKRFQIEGKKLEMEKKCPKCKTLNWYFEKQCHNCLTFLEPEKDVTIQGGIRLQL